MFAYACAMPHMRTSTSLSPTVLLTGFGPFPGMPENASAPLVRVVAQRARAAFRDHRFHAAVLPTEWHAAPQRVTALISRLQPFLSLHFGVAQDTHGFRIETQGLNTCRRAPDAAGRLPLDQVLVVGGPDTHPSSLPIDAIVDRLQALDLPVTTSQDAGGYLCNAVLYHALHTPRRPNVQARAGFIHIPTVFAGAPLTFETAVTGCLAIIDASLREKHA